MLSEFRKPDAYKNINSSQTRNSKSPKSLYNLPKDLLVKLVTEISDQTKNDTWEEALSNPKYYNYRRWCNEVVKLKKQNKHITKMTVDTAKKILERYYQIGNICSVRKIHTFDTEIFIEFESKSYTIFNDNIVEYDDYMGQTYKFKVDELV